MGNKGAEWVPLGDGSTPVEDPDKGLGHIVSIGVYNAVFISLLSLTAMTVWAATIETEWLHVPVALGIATIKAGIVTLFFMHLNYESKIIWGIVIYPVFILLLMIAGTLGDESVKEVPLPLRAKLEAEAEKSKEKSSSKGYSKKAKGESESSH